MANVTVIGSITNPDIQAGSRVSVRTSGNRVYTIRTQNVLSTPLLSMAKGNQDGEPTSFTGGDSLSVTDIVESGAAIAIDSNDLIHCIYYQNESAMAGVHAVRYVTYNTSTDTFGTPETIANMEFDDPFTEKLGIAIDVNGDPHVFWRDAVTSMGSTTFFNYYSNRISGSWSSAVTISNPSSDSGGIVNDIMIADPASSVNADRPIILEDAAVAINVYHGNALNATSFTTASNVSSDNNNNDISFAIDSNEKITIVFTELVSNDLMVVEHLNSSVWGTWETPVTIDTSTDYTSPSIAINGTDRFIYVEDSTNSDLNLWKDTGSGFTEETADDDLPNVGTFNDVKAKWSNYNNNSPTQLDYVFEDSSGDILYNTFSVAAPSVRDYHWHGHIPQPLF